MRKSVLLLAAILVWSALANASLIPSLMSETPMGGNFVFAYSANVSALEALDPTATNGVTCPGPGNTLVQCNPAGTFFTIYDIPGFVSAATTASGWTTTTQLVGITPSTINATPFDSPGITNVTFQYTGPVTPGAVTFTGFTVTSSDSGQNVDGHFSSQDTQNFGPDTGTTNQLDGSVTVPEAAVPEPDTLILMGAGLALAAAGIRRRSRV